MKCSPKGNGWLILAILLLAEAVVTAQPGLSPYRNARAAYERSGAELSFNRYDLAIQELKAAIQTDPDFTAAYQRLGDVYRITKNFAEARRNYEKVLSIDTGFYRGTWFGLGESELNLGEYEMAQRHFKRYLGYPGLPDDSRKKAGKYLADCAFSIQAIRSPVPFRPVNIGPRINSADPEYNAVLTADEETLIYTRQTNGQEDFYFSTKADGTWKQARPLPGIINTALNEGAQCLSPDGRYLFFTGCNRSDGLGSCDIYLSGKEGSSWSSPYHLPAPLNSTSWDSQPSISADGKTLYFASNRQGGLGGYDLWKSDLLDGGNWTTPVNLGPSVNTAYDEQSPFIHPDGVTLYFSSSGWPGLGNKDLFATRKDTSDNWRQPQNLGYPINTPGEESGITVASNGKHAWFNSSRKEGFGGLDIYSFDLPDAVRPKPVTYVKGTVFDKMTERLLGGGIRISDLESGFTVYDDVSDESDGTFLATLVSGKAYGIHISSPGYLFYSQNITLTDSGSALEPFLIKVALEPIAIGSTTVLRNIFFDSNKYDLLPDSGEELQLLATFLLNNPAVRIEIGGHTDNVGKDADNLALSEKRAKAVYDFLVARQVPASRLLFKGYGETRPIGSNTSEEGQKLNRRTEFKVIGN
jgi:outer membrane protein OmpA-like peptidoglycan-associated protein/tetratricopeptide (TPR) repeat protein